MPINWDQINGELKTVESSISDGIQELNNSIRDIGDDSAGPDQLSHLKNIESAIETQLRKYTKLLLEMESFVKAGDNSNHRTIYNRFRDVYKELSSSFRISKGNASQKTTRVELFSRQFSDKQQDDSETQLLLKEMTSTKNSLRMADSFLESASLSHENLRNQRNRLQRSSGVLGGITNRFPQINNLTRSIMARRNRDNLIVSIFVALCICICIWYTFR